MADSRRNAWNLCRRETRPGSLEWTGAVWSVWSRLAADGWMLPLNREGKRGVRAARHALMTRPLSSPGSPNPRFSRTADVRHLLLPHPREKVHLIPHP
ncbi:hypothetical protein E2C01_003217 [Portunus trituberculatus]|uniref:Uncharacterized protein n=1 Tax=Portunus trituberculatus TaxID=210409 RepID=A0A5B7CP70_PORTR|nr:hypothetical protein [Portunus trituberculatus]